MGWSPFTMTRTVSSSKRIHCSYGAALRFLHDPVELIDLNPVVIGREASSGDPNTYIVRDKMVILGRTSEFAYKVRFSTVEDGIDSEVQAPAGTRLKNQWRVRRVESGSGGGSAGGEGNGAGETVEVVEEVTVNAYFFLMPMTLSGLRDSHKTLLENLAAKLEGRTSISAGRPEI